MVPNLYFYIVILVAFFIISMWILVYVTIICWMKLKLHFITILILSDHGDEKEHLKKFLLVVVEGSAEK